MDTSDTFNSDPTTEQLLPEEHELSHTDKIIGVISSPGDTFSNISKFPLKTIDWLMPLFVYVILFIVAQIIMSSNPVIASDLKNKQDQAIQNMVDQKTITEEQAEQSRKMQEFMRGPIGMVISAITMLVFISIMFFIIAFIYHLALKIFLKVSEPYKVTLIPYGLIYYIFGIQIIVAALLAISFERLIYDTSLASFINTDRASILGWLTAKIDPITIWANIVLGIGLAKLYKSDNTTKFILLVFGVWLIGTLLLYYLATVFPFLKSFVGQ